MTAPPKKNKDQPVPTAPPAPSPEAQTLADPQIKKRGFWSSLGNAIGEALFGGNR